MSLDVVRAEVESMGKQHQNIAQQMKAELDESLSAFAGGLKERRKIVQGGIEKLHKHKTQQSLAVNKVRLKQIMDRHCGMLIVLRLAIVMNRTA